jgi:hypothetical protein
MEQPDLVEAAGGVVPTPEPSDEVPELDPVVPVATVDPALFALPAVATAPLDGIEPDISAVPAAAVVPAEPGEPVPPMRRMARRSTCPSRRPLRP